MRKKCAGVLAVSLLTVGLMGAAPPSEAQTFVGEICFKLDPFVDTIRVALTSYPNSMYGAFVRWRGGTAWQFQGSGLLSPDTSTPGDWLFTFSSAGTTSNFSCNFQAHLVAKTWSYQCPSTGFSNSGTFTRLSTCPSTATPQPHGTTSMPAN